VYDVRRGRIAAWTTVTVAGMLGAGAGNAAPNGALNDKVVVATGASIVALSPDGSARRTITPRYLPAEIADPSEHGGSPFELLPDNVGVSPDGDTVAFTTSRSNYYCCRRYSIDGELFVIQPDGSGLRRLTTTPSRDELQPVFSPDGKRIAFLQDAGIGQADTPMASLAVVDVDGSNLRVLAAAEPRMTSGDVRIAWHPDSRRLLFYPGAPYTGELLEHSLLIDVASGARRKVYGGPATFSPDGGKLAMIWGGEIYAGTLSRFSTPTFARRLRPVVAREFSKTGKPKNLPSDVVWLRDGRLLFTMDDETVAGCGQGSEHVARAVLGVVGTNGRRTMLPGRTCPAGVLLPSPATPTQFLWVGPVLAVSPVARWQPRVLRDIPVRSVTFGYEPATCQVGGAPC